MVVTVLVMLPAVNGYAGNRSAQFNVSVRVIASCHWSLPNVRPSAAKLVMSCSRGSGYQIRVDQRLLTTGVGSDVVPVSPQGNSHGPALLPGQTPQVHWLTILF